MADAGGGDGDAEAGGDEAQDGEPMGGFLDDVRTKAVLFEEGQGLFEGADAGGARVVDEGLVAQVGGIERLLPSAGMGGGEDGYKGLGEEWGEVKGGGGIGVAEDAGVE